MNKLQNNITSCWMSIERDTKCDKPIKFIKVESFVNQYSSANMFNVFSLCERCYIIYSHQILNIPRETHRYVELTEIEAKLLIILK